MSPWAEEFSRASQQKAIPRAEARGNGESMEKLNQFWEFISGKKTAIGGTLLIAGNILRKFPQTMVAAEIVSEIGMYLTGFGLAHKGLKAATVGK